MAGRLSLRLAVRIAMRDLRATPGKFILVIFALAVGVAALTGVRALGQSFRAELMARAKSILAADVAAITRGNPSSAEQQKISALDADSQAHTIVTETVSMVATPADPNPLLVALKIVDPNEYPLYGEVQLDTGQPLAAALTDSTVVVGEPLLVRMRVDRGSVLTIGSRQFTIAAVIRHEPDVLTESVGLGPRVMITRSAATTAGLLAPGARANDRYLFRLRPGTDLDAFSKRLQSALPAAQVMDYREGNPVITDGVAHATAILSLICLVALVLGGIGVAMTMRAHLAMRMNTIAIIKSLGGTSAQILKIYLFQALALAIAGSLLGAAVGYLVERTLPELFRSLITLPTTIHMSWTAAAMGFAAGLLTTFLFTMPALLAVRDIRPGQLLRRDFQPSSNRSLGAQVATAVILLIGLAAIAAVLSDSAMVGRWFAIGLAAALAFLLGAAWVLLKLLRALLRHGRTHLPASVRFALAGLYRPGNQTGSILAALGVGVMLSMTVFLVQRGILRDIRVAAPRDLPNVFLVDISPSEKDGVVNLITHQSGVKSPPEMIPIVTGGLSAVNGKPVSQLDLPEQRKKFLMSSPLTYAATQPAGLTIKQGSWWPADTHDPLVSVGDRTATRLHIAPGTKLTFTADGRDIPVTVAAIHGYASLRAGSRSEFVFPPATLAGAPVIWYGGVHVQPDDVPALERAMFAAYPTVSVVNLADALALIRKVVDQISIIVECLAGFVIFAAIVLLSASIVMTRYRRISEIAILKALGATRQYVSTVVTIEFAVIGALAGAIGVVFANLLARVMLHRMQVAFIMSWSALFAGIAATALLAIAAGWLSSARNMGQRPLAVLREE
jgi:putative ABC transport system permease protein